MPLAQIFFLIFFFLLFLRCSVSFSVSFFLFSHLSLSTLSLLSLSLFLTPTPPSLSFTLHFNLLLIVLHPIIFSKPTISFTTSKAITSRIYYYPHLNDFRLFFFFSFHARRARKLFHSTPVLHQNKKITINYHIRDHSIFKNIPKKLKNDLQKKGMTAVQTIVFKFLCSSKKKFSSRG